jgi:hypothetical protein
MIKFWFFFRLISLFKFSFIITFVLVNIQLLYLNCNIDYFWLSIFKLILKLFIVIIYLLVSIFAVMTHIKQILEFKISHCLMFSQQIQLGIDLNLFMQNPWSKPAFASRRDSFDRAHWLSEMIVIWCIKALPLAGIEILLTSSLSTLMNSETPQESIMNLLNSPVNMVII